MSNNNPDNKDLIALLLRLSRHISDTFVDLLCVSMCVQSGVCVSSVGRISVWACNSPEVCRSICF